MARESEPEVPLPGGHMTAVVRVGDTVRGTAGPWTPTIHALLRHVRAAGFTLAPEPLGIDEQGREILTFVPGVAGGPPDVIFAEETLDGVARMLRAFHDATAGFALLAGGTWQFPVHEPVEVVCHNDVAPYNLVFEGGALADIIERRGVPRGGGRAHRRSPLTGPSHRCASSRGAMLREWASSRPGSRR